MILLLAACSDQSVGKFNGEPAAEILSHKDGDAVTEAATVTFSGAASDPDDDATSLTTTWSLNGATVCEGAPEEDGATACDVVIPAGAAEVLLEVRDPDGAAASAKVTLDVIPLESPEVSILAPTSGDRGYTDTALTLVGSAFDPDTSTTDLTYTWTSSLDGDLASGSPTSDGGIDDLVFLSEGNHTLTLRASDPQGYADDAQIALSVLGPDTAPTCVITEPAAGTYATGVDLLLSGTVGDAEEPADALTVTWTSDRDGELYRGNAATDGVTSLTAALSAGTHILTLAATDEVGLGCSDTVIVTLNTAPTAPTVTIDPEAPTTEDTLLATASGATDPDGDPLTLHHTWTVDGVDAGITDTTVPADRTTKGETWVVTAWADDGRVDGPVATASVRIGNAAPSATAPTISPSPARTTDTLTCTPGTFTDADGDADASTLAWTVNGALVGTGTTLVGGYVSGDLVTCTVSPFDGTDAGADVSASLTIANTAPEAPTVSISPSSPIEGDELLCSIASASRDADGDAVAYTMAWTVDGVPVASDTTLWPGDTVIGTLEGETWTCTATPDDGEDDGTPASATVTVGAAAFDYTGSWTLDRSISYSCAFGLVSINFNKMTVTDTNPLISVRVSGNPGTMSGAFSTATYFDVDNVLPGTCTETYTMGGTFTGEDSFTGTFEAAYSGSCFDCTGGSWIFNATR